jgi:hypothetical protein
MLIKRLELIRKLSATPEGIEMLDAMLASHRARRVSSSGHALPARRSRA